jgi:membrane protease YdiL (CAAX protease family)
MNLFAQQDPPLVFITIVFFAIGAFLVTWAAIIEKWFSGRTIIPYQPRRRVPWNFWDLLAIFCFYFVGLVVLLGLVQYILSPDAVASSDKATIEPTSTDHPLIQLLLTRDWKIIVACIVFGVVVTPIIEEMFFRVFLQGCLENVDRDCRRRWPMLRSCMPVGLMPILFSSLFFAWLHYREAAPHKDVEYLMCIFVCNGAMSLLSLFFAVVWVHWWKGATAIDLGWKPENFLADLQLGIFTFVAISVPIFGSQVILSQLLPKNLAPDPIPIFFFAIALGFLYHRTHRAAPSIALHMALNATSLGLVLLLGAG